MVKNMYSAYFAHTASQPINVDSHARTGADADILDPSSQSFRLAECQVYSLMRDDSYVRFLRSDLFATRVKQEISSGIPSSHKKDKDHGLVSWYKTSLRPRLSRSVKKRPKSVNLGNIPSTSSSSLPGSSSALTTDQTRLSGDENDTQSCNPSHPPSDPSLSSTHPSASLPSTIPESPRTPPPCCSGGRESLSRFMISPLSPFNLTSDREFEDFFAQVVSCSQKAPNVESVVGDDRPLKFTSIFHSQPCLPELEDDGRNRIPSSPSLHDVFDAVSKRTKTKHHNIHSYPAPPLPPKATSLRGAPPRPPPKAPVLRRNLHSYETLYV